MRQRDITAENIGQVIQGSVHANTLVLNVGGQPHPLCEIDSDQVAHLRRVVMKAIAFRTKLAFAPRLVTCAAIIWLWWNIPAAVASADGLTDSERLIAALIMAGMSVVSAWAVVQINMGAWMRRHRKAIAELETVLAKIDAELDMRKPLTEFGAGALFRTLFPPVRFRSFHQPQGDI
jgi:hypothetical protein